MVHSRMEEKRLNKQTYFNPNKLLLWSAASCYLLSLCLAQLAAAHQQHNEAELAQASHSLDYQLAALSAAAQNPISPANNQQQQQLPSTEQSTLARSRSPRSIGEMFKKLFNGNKRAKQANRDWDQQQQLQQQQAQQQQQLAQQAVQQNMAASLAAAAANQHAVYASPFAAYSPAAAAQSAQSALYSQFGGPSLVAWPTSAGLAQALRPTTLIGTPSTATMTLAGGAAPLYAAASQSYNSYAAPPQTAQTSGSPAVAASHAHPSAVAAPPGNSALDFHQVLDAFVRTSGFTPAGDQEAAAASGYGPKSDGTPVFSFKKLISLPFYLSTEEKPLDGLANAVAPSSAGYSLHTMPIMRRHVRRMSTPQQQQQQQLNNYAATIQQAQDSNNQIQRRERAQQQQYNQYMNAIGNQLASVNANNQLVQYLSQQQSVPSIASQMEAYSAEAALANYQALLGAAGASSQPASYNTKRSVTSGQQQQMAASMVAPVAVQAPAQLVALSQRQQQQDELQALLSSFQQQMQSGTGTALAEPYASYSLFNPSQFQPTLVDGHRFGAANPASQQQPLGGQSAYWPPANSNQMQPASYSATVSQSTGDASNAQANGSGSAGNQADQYIPGQMHSNSAPVSSQTTSVQNNGSPMEQAGANASGSQSESNQSIIGTQHEQISSLHHHASQQQNGRQSGNNSQASFNSAQQQQQPSSSQVEGH